MPAAKVNKEETQKFSQVWNYNGVYTPVTDVQIQFATDWANIVLRNFIQQCQADVAAATKKAEKSILLES